MKITFVTGNKKKAEYLEKYIGMPVDILSADMEEIQSMKLEDIVKHKLMRAYELVQGPVIVEDVSVEFEALGGFPGPFIRFFLDTMSMEDICELVVGKSKKVKASCVMGYYDGEDMKFFEGSLDGTVADSPAEGNGFGWDVLFIPDGYDVTRSALDDEDYQKTYLQLKRIDVLKEYLTSKNYE